MRGLLAGLRRVLDSKQLNSQVWRQEHSGRWYDGQEVRFLRAASPQKGGCGRVLRYILPPDEDFVFVTGHIVGGNIGGGCSGAVCACSFVGPALVVDGLHMASSAGSKGWWRVPARVLKNAEGMVSYRT